MSFLKDALEFLQAEFQPAVKMVGEKTFSTEVFTEIKPEPSKIPACLEVCTLSGFSDAIEFGLNTLSASDFLIHVATSQMVNLIWKNSDEHGRRLTLLKSTNPQYEGFPFGIFLDPASFVIKAQSLMVPSDDLDDMIRIASNITEEKVTTSEDDGIGQRVGIRQGVALRGVAVLKARRKLAPFRTFPEVEQPTSDFILRIQPGNEKELPKLALFEADGGRWKNEAMKNIADFLEARATGIPIIF